jgi:hypothetical protein
MEKYPLMGNEKFPPWIRKGVEMEGKGVCFLPRTMASGGSDMVKGELWQEVHIELLG